MRGAGPYSRRSAGQGAPPPRAVVSPTALSVSKAGWIEKLPDRSTASRRTLIIRDEATAMAAVSDVGVRRDGDRKVLAAAARAALQSIRVICVPGGPANRASSACASCSSTFDSLDTIIRRTAPFKALPETASRCRA